MRNALILAQTLAVLKTYATRPLMWLAGLIVGLSCFALLADSKSTQLRDAFPSPFDQAGASVLRDGETFLRWVSDGTVHPEITAIDFNSMGSAITLKNLDPVTRRAELRMFDELQHALLQFPNLETLQFDMQQLPFVKPETLAALTKLRSIRVRDLPITALHIDLLTNIESLEYLELQTLHLPASLEPLEVLPKLTAVVVSNGYYIMTDQPAASPFRRQILSELSQLPALQRLVLKPPYLPGVGYFAGSVEPDPSCDPIIKENVAEVFREHPRLTHLWVGANQRAEERVQLEAVASALPTTAVRAATYDRSKLMKISGSATTLFVAMGLLVLQLTSQFSAPASQLLPGFARRHLGVAALLMFGAVLVLILSVHHHQISLLAAAAVYTATLAWLLAFNAWWDQMLSAPRGWTQYLPIVVFLGIALFFSGSILLPPQSLQWLDQFLIGSFPMVAGGLLIASLTAVCIGLSSFGNLHRNWAELALAPAMTLRELSERSNSVALRRLGDKYLAGQMGSWERAVQAASVKLQQGSRLALCRLWYLAQTPLKLLRGLAIVAIISCAAFYLLSIRLTYSARLAVLFYTVFLVLYIGCLIVAIACLGRRSALSLDLLHPVSRRDMINSAFVAVFLQVAAATGFALVITWVQRSLLLDVPEVSSLLRGGFAMGALTILLTGTLLCGMLSHRLASAVLAVLISMLAICLVSMVVIDTGMGESPAAAAKVRELLHHAAVLPGLWLLAVTTFALAYRSWTRAEFAAEQ